MKIGFLLLALVGLGSVSVRAQLAVFDPSFSGTARSDLDLGSHTIVGGSWNGPSQLVQLDASGRLPVADGSRLTNLNASSLVSGTVADALLGGNIPRLNAANAWSADQAFSPHLLDVSTGTAAARWLRVATWLEKSVPITFWVQAVDPENPTLATLFKVTVGDVGSGLAPVATVEGGLQGSGTTVDQIRVVNDGGGHTCLDLHWTVANAHVHLSLLALGGAGGVTYAVAENPSLTGMVSSTYSLPQVAGMPTGFVADAVQSSGVVAGVHLAGAGGTPSIATGNGAGISATASVTGTDLAGTITVNVGLAPQAAATIVTLTFATPFATAPHPVLSAGNSAAAALWGSSNVYTTTTTTALTLKSNASAVAASTQYVWHYHFAQ